MNAPGVMGCAPILFYNHGEELQPEPEDPHYLGNAPDPGYPPEYYDQLMPELETGYKARNV